jgi:hypothetical protein
MNKQRKTELDSVENALESLLTIIQNIKEDEEEYVNNVPENLQGSEKYSQAEESIPYLEDACSNIEEAISNINFIIND